MWREKVHQLTGAGALATVDGELLAAFCVASDQLAQVTLEINRRGSYIETPLFDRNGTPTGHSVQKANPLLKVQDSLMGRVNQLAAALGIGPTNRARLSGAGPAEPSSAATNPVIAIRDRIAIIRAAQTPG